MVQTAACVENEASEAPQAAAPVPAIDEGLLSLAMIAAFYRIACDPAQMAHDLGLGRQAPRILSAPRGGSDLKRARFTSRLRSGFERRPCPRSCR
jgi:hypothetical protein